MSQMLINYFAIFIIIVVIGFLYNRYEDKIFREKTDEDYSSIQKYLLNDIDSLADDKLPILWIHVKHEYNCRSWLSFGSRSSFCLNQPYLYLTIKTIIQKCSDSFKICIIDDSSFSKLLPEWNVKMNFISDPILNNYRQLGLMQILQKYGGLLVPCGFVCFKDLIDLYNQNISNNQMFVVENIDRNITSVHHSFYPDISFMGCIRECPIMKKLIQFMQKDISNDFTAQSVFLGDFNRFIQMHKEHVNIVDGKLIGIKGKKYQTPITIEMMFEQDYLDLDDNAYGVLIPSNEILSRRHFEWFARMSEKQVLECNSIICKYLLLALGFENIQNMKNTNMNKPFVAFFSTPLLPESKFNVSQNSGLYMTTQPNMLGDNVPTIFNNNFLKIFSFLLRF